MNRSLSQVDSSSSPDEKVRLFRSLFRGRDDVFARQYNVRSRGRIGWAPACGNEWLRGVCEKPRVKCVDCRHQHFLPITDEIARWHLSGSDLAGHPFVMGIYPLLRDESCWLSVIQLDSLQWMDDATAIYDSCRRLDLAIGVERCHGGQRGNVWFFYSEPLAAALARRLAATILTEAMDHRPAVGFATYDRIIPSQDTLPSRGFGGVIALPLQKRSREQGDSLFLDRAFQPIRDQWLWLSNLQRISRKAAEMIVARADRRGRVLGVRAVPSDSSDPPQQLLPKSRGGRQKSITRKTTKPIELTLRERISVPAADLSPRLYNQLLRLAAFENVEFLTAQTMRRSVGGLPQIITCAEEFPDHLALPRGCLDEVRQRLVDSGFQPETIDQRQVGMPLTVRFQGGLSASQLAAAHRLAAHDTGVLIAPPGFGKTAVGAWLIAARRVSTLVIVHRRQLMDQWIASLSRWLDVPRASIGPLGVQSESRVAPLQVALFQGLVRRSNLAERLAAFGHVVVDECHHLAAPRFTEVLQAVSAKYITGLSATLERKDGHHPVVTMQCGPVRYRALESKASRANGHERTVLVRPTDFDFSGRPSDDRRVHFGEVCAQLIEDPSRNQLICDDIRRSISAGHSPLILTERHAHLKTLARQLESLVPQLVVLRGGMNKGQASEAAQRLASIADNEPRVVLAIGAYLGEGFDDRRLDSLFLTYPISWRGTVVQYVGRLHRCDSRKREVRVYDYADLNVPMLARMFDRRCRAFESTGYRIHLPASAAPGWPAEVELPVDPAWKRDYAASVQRLGRDGVDRELAHLFRDATKPVASLNGDVQWARSATEAFLFRRLDSLPETTGRFQLNARLPIPFDGNSGMEVDLLCTDARLAIELDGAQHLDSRAAYRTDRHKDLLLQRHGYVALRFLAEDVGPRLGVILDAILASLTNRLPT